MKLLFFLVALGCLTWPLQASPPHTETHSLSTLEITEEDAIENLLNYAGNELGLEKLIQEARKDKIAEQTLREARLLFYIKHKDEAGLSLLAAEYIKTGVLFKESESQLFSQTNDWLGIIEFLKSIRARRAGNTAEFKHGITQAFWLSPANSWIFAPFLERHHRRLALQDIRINENKSFTNVSGDTKTLGTWLQEKKALALYFWSPWSMDCIESMHSYLQTKRTLQENGIHVISIIVQPTEQLRKETPSFLKRYNISAHEQFYDDKEDSLVKNLQIQSLPSLSLIKDKGKFVFSGRLDEPELWEQLLLISPKIQRTYFPTDFASP